MSNFLVKNASSEYGIGKLPVSGKGLSVAGILEVDSMEASGDLVVTGDLTVNGTTTTVDSETVQLADNHLLLNSTYVSTTPQTGGNVVINHGTTDTDASVVAAPTATTITTNGGTNLFSAGKYFQITGGGPNDGIYRAASHAANLLTIETTGDDFIQTSLDTVDVGGMTITGIDISVMRAGTDGAWEQAAGSTGPLSFTDVSSVDGGAGTDTTALHDNEAGEISAITLKGTLVAADLFVIEDSAAGNAKKRTTMGDIDHDLLTNYAVAEHIDWTLDAGASNMNDANIIASNVTQHEASINHDALTNFVAAEHVDWAGAGAGTIHTDNYIEGGAGSDTDAIHDNVASEISALTLVTVAAGDHVMIEDVSDANNKKRVLASDLIAGTGDVSKVGTPVNNQIGIWTGDGTIEGSADFTYDGAGALLYSDPQDALTELKVQNVFSGGSCLAAMRVNSFNGGISVQARSPATGTYTNQAVILVDAAMSGLTFDVKDPINFLNTVSGSVNMMSMSNTAIHMNSGTADLSFKVSGTTDVNLLFVNPSANRLQVGTLTNGGGAGIKFLVDGVTAFTEVAAPATPAAGFLSIYAKTDGILYTKNDSGTEVPLNADVFKVGTPVDNQIGIWTGDGTLEGITLFTHDGATLTVGGALKVAFESVTDDTLDATHHYVSVNTTAAVRTINLPAASGLAGLAYFIRNNGTAANDVTLDASGAETINGSTTLALADGESAMVVCDGAGWQTF